MGVKPRYTPATRKAVPLICAVSGPSGSGKTLSSLLFAAGLAGPGGWVRLVDTENERGLFYADDPLIQAALPQGWEHRSLSTFHPADYIEQINDAEKAGVNVLVIDSGSHEWEGPGGCIELAEKNKGRWNKPKLLHKQFVYRLLYSQMHIVVCLRAREKSKIVPAAQSATGKEETISIGILPICEKSFMFEMLVSLMLDERTHHVIPVKVPNPLREIFKAGALLSKEHGDLLREWNAAGEASDPAERLQRRARAAAENGVAEYQSFFASITKDQRHALNATTHDRNKEIALRADEEAAMRDESDGSSDDYIGTGNPESDREFFSTVGTLTTSQEAEV